MFYPARIMLRHFLRDPDAAQELFECYIGIVDFGRYCITVFRQVDLMVFMYPNQIPRCQFAERNGNTGFLDPQCRPYIH